LLALLLVFAALLSYLNSFTAPFIFDDRKWIIDDPQVRDLAADWRRLDIGRRPVVFLSLAVNYHLGYLDVRGYHLFNVIVHTLAGLLLFGIVRRTIQLHSQRRGGDLPAADLGFVVALLWLVHPLQTESVTYVIQRCESMMGMSFLLCLYCVIRGSQAAGGWPWYSTAIAACALGLGCKEVMATAPLVILLYDRVFLSSCWSELLRKRGWVYAFLFGTVLALFVVMTPAILGGAGGSAGFGYGEVTPLVYLQTQPGILLHYLRLAFWPRPLCLDYHWRPAESPMDIYPPAAAVVGLLVGSLVTLRYRPWLGFLGLSFFLVLAPTSSIMPIADLAVEHRMYLPIAPVVTAMVLLLYATTQRGLSDPHARRLARVAATFLSVLALVGLTLQRNADYCDPLRMWAKVVQVAPHNYRAHNGVGEAYGKKGDHVRERRHYEQAIAIKPDFERAYLNMGVLLARQGDVRGAAQCYRRALELKPNYVVALVNYGNLLCRQQKWNEAEIYYRQALQIQPRNANALLNLATALRHAGKLREAGTAYRETLETHPHMIDAKIGLAWILATAPDSGVRDGQQAMRLAEEAHRQTGGLDYRVFDVSAAAYADLGRYEDACRAAAQGVEFAKAAGLDHGLAEMESRLKGYQSRKPYRDEPTAPAVTPVSETLEERS
jgi:protein O-mannosyl-transferase